MISTGPATRRTYDYIVIGCGAAGSIVAARLASQAGASVLVIEAGPALKPARDRFWDPHTWLPLSQDPAIEWGFCSVPQQGLNSRTIPMPQARAFGGSQMHNAMVYVRGARSDYDGWATLGCAGWSWEGVVPHFEGVESVVPILTGEPDAFLDSLFEAASQVGLPFNPNYNESATQYGHARFQFTIDPSTQLRETSYSCYLLPALASGADITLLSGTAARIVFEGARAVGVDYLDAQGYLQRASASTELVISAGALSSPALLQRSGIGDAALLTSLGISTLVDAPEVGANLYDDLYVTVAYACPRPLPEQPCGLAAAVLFGSSTGRPDGPVDLEISCSSGAMIGMPQIPGIEHSCWLWPNLLKLASRGTVKIRSTSPVDRPLVDPGYLTAPGDIDRCIAGVKLGRAVGSAPGLAPWTMAELLPGPGVVTDQQIAEYARSRASTTQHYVGTCRMGADARSAVDPALRVRGVDGLRVIDASILPAPITGNTAAVSMMIGHKGASMMIASRNDATGRASESR